MLRSCYYYSWRMKSSRCIGVLNAFDCNLSDARPPSAKFKALKSSKQAQKGLIGVFLKTYETPAGLDETWGASMKHLSSLAAKWAPRPLRNHINLEAFVGLNRALKRFIKGRKARQGCIMVLKGPEWRFPLKVPCDPSKGNRRIFCFCCRGLGP